MASVSSKVDRVGGDQQESNLLSPVEDQSCLLIDERGDHGSSTKQNAQDVTAELIARESGRDVAQSDSQSAAQSSDSRDNDDKKRRDMCDKFVVDKEIGSDVDCNVRFKKKGKVRNVESGTPRLMEYDPTIDERLPETVTLLTTPDGGKLYLVGTAHFSVKSQNDVSKIIQAVQPHIVAVELCRNRVGIMQIDEKEMFDYVKNIDYQTIRAIIKEDGLYEGLLHILIMRMSAYVTKQLGMPPGGEFRMAFKEAKNVPNCIVHLADRPLSITMQRAMRLLSWWQTIKLGYQLLILKDPITQEEVELYKQRSMMDEMLASIKEEFPVLGEVFVKERDIYLTNSLQLACRPHSTSPYTFEPTRVVGIVGAGHTPGIIENWGKVEPSDILPLMKVPPPPLTDKIVKLTIKASILVAVIYVGYKIVAVPTATAFHSLKSSVQGLLQVGAAR
ncbi:PREDICTED: traB domain-containing protein isoform X2 [Vollenhovia emeryi]|uniref:traB domain-containing protein isoform X2 n=1 Tax=Vollenhovia emeryi TaxID=411798 RepID=UPI0005F52796|nr:PREDICTED: traB domain-containing protein isoform X2 [Vollenhovia emeryi]